MSFFSSQRACSSIESLQDIPVLSFCSCFCPASRVSSDQLSPSTRVASRYAMAFENANYIQYIPTLGDTFRIIPPLPFPIKVSKGRMSLKDYPDRLSCDVNYFFLPNCLRNVDAPQLILFNLWKIPNCKSRFQIVTWNRKCSPLRHDWKLTLLPGIKRGITACVECLCKCLSGHSPE